MGIDIHQEAYDAITGMILKSLTPNVEDTYTFRKSDIDWLVFTLKAVELNSPSSPLLDEEKQNFLCPECKNTLKETNCHCKHCGKKILWLEDCSVETEEEETYDKQVIIGMLRRENKTLIEALRRSSGCHHCVHWKEFECGKGLYKECKRGDNKFWKWNGKVW